MKVESFLLVSTLNIVIAQRLVRKLSVSKIKYFLNKEELASLGNVVSLERILTLLRNEKIIGKKWEAEAPRFIIESDATIVAPLLFEYVLGG